MTVTRGYTPNGLNQYTAAGPATFSYDANGNLTSDGSTTYGYDAENRLTSASGAKVASLAYDPLGRLAQISGGSGGTQQLVHNKIAASKRRGMWMGGIPPLGYRNENRIRTGQSSPEINAAERPNIDVRGAESVALTDAIVRQSSPIFKRLWCLT